MNLRLRNKFTHVLSCCESNSLFRTKDFGGRYKSWYDLHVCLSAKFIMRRNVQMPTIVGILTFISMMNTTCKRLKQEASSFVGVLVFMSIQEKFKKVF